MLDAKLILYTPWNMENSLGWNTEYLIKQYKVPRETIISPMQLRGRPKLWMNPEPIEVLREIAILGDVYPSTTSGEGFGRCGLEALSLKIPVAITDYSACSEVHQKGSILVPCYEGRAGRFRWHDKVRACDGGVVNEEKFTEALLRLYDNPKERKELGIQAREWAREFDYATKIIPQWIDILNKINPDIILQNELLTT